MTSTSQWLTWYKCSKKIVDNLKKENKMNEKKKKKIMYRNDITLPLYKPQKTKKTNKKQ